MILPKITELGGTPPPPQNGKKIAKKFLTGSLITMMNGECVERENTIRD